MSNKAIQTVTFEVTFSTVQKLFAPLLDKISNLTYNFPESESLI